MKRKSVFLSFILLLLLVLSSCGQNAEKEDGAEEFGNGIPDVMNSADNLYEIAFCLTEPFRDGGFNEGTYQGVKEFAAGHGKSYKYYSAKSPATDEDIAEMLNTAILGGAKVILCTGYNFTGPLATVAAGHPEIRFIHVDGSAQEGLENIAAISFRDQECGFLAGYAAVKEGFTRLGFTGGGGGSNDSVNRYGYGYLQGAEMAAEELGVTVEMRYTYQYGTSYLPSPELQALCDSWYEEGTEVVFACGGKICNSVISAAAANDGYVIGVDVDQSDLSRTVLTSAMKRVDQAAVYALECSYAGEWEKISEKTTVLGAKEGAVGLPTGSWRMKNFTAEEYEDLLEAIVSGNITVDGDYSKLAPAEHVDLKMM